MQALAPQPLTKRTLKPVSAAKPTAISATASQAAVLAPAHEFDGKDRIAVGMLWNLISNSQCSQQTPMRFFLTDETQLC